MFKRITIIGLGLIGGSLGMVIKEKHLAGKITGVSRRRSTIVRALSLKAVDKVTLDMKRSVKDADLVIVAAPVLKIIDIAKVISKELKKGAIVTDAGSTKADIVKEVEKILPKTVKFVGSHPLAGSEKSGIAFADKDLFKGAYCVLTKSNKTDSKAISKLKKFWTGLGMKVDIMSPDKHDKILSRLSHLPHASGTALCNACGKNDLYLSAGGFRDTTRIASGNPELWLDIFLTNRKNVARDIKNLKKELSKIEAALNKNNKTELLRLLRKAKIIRDSISL